MRTLFVPITEQFENIAEQCGTNPYDILETFIAHVSGTTNKSDTEECFMAQEYLCRTHVHSTEKYQILKDQLNHHQQ